MRIVHKCLNCGHFDTAGWNPSDITNGAYHGANNYKWPRVNCAQGCKGCERGCDWGPSQLVKTYTWPHEPETKLYPPGEVWSGILCCGCDDCGALYADSTAGVST